MDSNVDIIEEINLATTTKKDSPEFCVQAILYPPAPCAFCYRRLFSANDWKVDGLARYSKWIFCALMLFSIANAFQQIVDCLGDNQLSFSNRRLLYCIIRQGILRNKMISWKVIVVLKYSFGLQYGVLWEFPYKFAWFLQTNWWF